MDTIREISHNIIPVLFFDKTEPHNNEYQSSMVNCLKCEKCYNFPLEKNDYLAHLFLEHRLIIADVEEIPFLEDYLSYWRKQFQQYELEEYCTTMLLDQLPDGSPSKNEKYYLLSDVVSLDYELRRKLKSKLLEKVLSQHQYELTDRTFSKECLYCRDVISGLRSTYLEHLFTKHFLQLGKPENLVFIDELLEKVKHNMEQLICLYCEKIFKDRPTLKEHMRKKAHKRINPNLKEYDKYFLENYRLPEEEKERNFTKKEKQRQQLRYLKSKKNINNSQETLRVDFEQRFADQSKNSDVEWEDWADEISQLITCLFCSERYQSYANFKQHLHNEHDVDFENCLKGLNFYHRIKMVNYVRRQVCLRRCVTCNKGFDSSEMLLQHLKEAKHYGVGAQKQWNKPEYFFSTYEDDSLLCLLDDNPNDDVDDVAFKIISEDSLVQINKEAEKLSLENFNFL